MNATAVLRVLLQLVLGVVLAACAPTTPSHEQQPTIRTEVPAQPSPEAQYLFYLHGRIVEEEGPRPTDPRFGIYEYQETLDSLAASGATVIAEQRPAGTDFRVFGAHVAGQVRQLLAAGVPADRIAVVGFSKGGAIAIIAAALLQQPSITFVFLGACGDWLEGRDDVDVHGRILSIYEKSDELGTSCEPLFARASTPLVYREIQINTGLGHGAFYRPRAEWLQPVRDWVSRIDTATSKLAVEGEGLRVFLATSGSARPVPFGAPAHEVIDILTRVLGAPPNEDGVNADCAARFVKWEDALTAWFTRDRFAGWSLDRNSQLTTASGVGIGSTRAQLLSVYAAEIVRSSLGEEFTAGGVAGLLESSREDARITHLWAGVTCIAR